MQVRSAQDAFQRGPTRITTDLATLNCKSNASKSSIYHSNNCLIIVRYVGSRGCKLWATLIVSRSICLCVSANLMLNFSETKRFRGSCPKGTLI